MSTLSEDQVRVLFEATVSHRLHALWVLLVTTGLRSGEALALTWHDIDWQAQSLSVRSTVQRERGKGIFVGSAKTDGSRRHIQLAPEAIEALQHHRDRQTLERRKALDLWADRDLVFCTETGGLIDPASVYKSLKACLAAAGLPSVRVHDLRHTAATLLLESNVHPKIVQELLGHSSITLTLDTYSHITRAMSREVADTMSGLFRTKAAHD